MKSYVNFMVACIILFGMLGVASAQDVRIGSLFGPRTLEPITAQNIVERHLCDLVYESMFKYGIGADGTAELRPYFVERHDPLNQPNPLFRLKEGIFWSDGSTLTRHDIRATVRFLTRNSAPFYQDVRYRSVLSRVTVRNERECRIAYRGPGSESRGRFNFKIIKNGLLSSDDLRRGVRDPRKIVGTGPFAVDHIDPTQIRFSRNALYTSPGNEERRFSGNVQKLTLIVSPNYSELTQRLENPRNQESIDMLMGLREADRTRFIQREYTIIPLAMGSFLHLGFNYRNQNGPSRLFEQIEFRRALGHAMNIPGLEDVEGLKFKLEAIRGPLGVTGAELSGVDDSTDRYELPDFISQNLNHFSKAGELMRRLAYIRSEIQLELNPDGRIINALYGGVPMQFNLYHPESGPLGNAINQLAGAIAANVKTSIGIRINPIGIPYNDWENRRRRLGDDVHLILNIGQVDSRNDFTRSFDVKGDNIYGHPREFRKEIQNFVESDARRYAATRSIRNEFFIELHKILSSRIQSIFIGGLPMNLCHRREFRFTSKGAVRISILDHSPFSNSQAWFISQ